MAKKPEPVPTEPAEPTAVVGVSGVLHYGKRSRVEDEFHPNLRGRLAARVYREITDNDSRIGGSLNLVKNTIRQVPWSVREVGDGPKSAAAADFVSECMEDMEHTWDDFIADTVSMLPYGFAPFEKVLKTRGGRSTDRTRNSKYKDGKMGWRGFFLRTQESLYNWEWDDQGNVLGMWQFASGVQSSPVFIPIEKMLLMRTENNRGSPEGRALAMDTPIPTPDGWKKMGDLHAGSKVFDEAGRVRYVTARKDWTLRPCFRVTFNDGTSIIADANHQWVVKDKHARDHKLDAKIVTTQEMSHSVKAGSANNPVSNYAIQWAEPLDYPEQLLPIHPYFMGLWLGDGTAATSDISCHVDDLEETMQYIRECGFSCESHHNGVDGGKGRLIRVFGEEKWDSAGPAHQLRVLGLKNNKHIPAAYLRGSVEQRMELLRGLMDSDGHVDAFGRCEFCNVNKNLSLGVAELVRSLGEDARVTLKTRNEEGHQNVWLVKFTPTHEMFKLRRKREKIKNIRAREMHYVVSIEPAGAQDTACIEVDGPNHMFLAGEGMIPTHNSLLRNIYRAWFFLKRIQELEAIGVERDLVGLPVMELPISLFDSTDPKKVAALGSYKLLIQQIRRNDHEGLVLPTSMGIDGKPTGYKLQLLSSGGARAVDADKIITRLKNEIGINFSTGFQELGLNSKGSQSLSVDQTDTFGLFLGAILRVIKENLNRNALPELMELNGFPVESWPEITHGDVEKPSLERFAAGMKSLVDAQLITPDTELEDFIREEFQLPPRMETDLGEGMPAPIQPVPPMLPGVPVPPGPNGTEPVPPFSKPGPGTPSSAPQGDAAAKRRMAALMAAGVTQWTDRTPA